MYNCGKNNKKKNENGSNQASAVEKKNEEIIVIVTEMNLVAITKSSDWWLDSRATIHVCNDKAIFSTYKEEEDGQSVLSGNYDTIEERSV